jgi:hypothetical protein
VLVIFPSLGQKFPLELGHHVIVNDNLFHNSLKLSSFILISTIAKSHHCSNILAFKASSLRGSSSSSAESLVEHSSLSVFEIFCGVEYIFSNLSNSTFSILNHNSNLLSDLPVNLMNCRDQAHFDELGKFIHLLFSPCLCGLCENSFAAKADFQLLQVPADVNPKRSKMAKLEY